MFWELAPPEVDAILERRLDQERARNMRAGLIAAQVLNVHRKPGAPLFRWQHFFREAPRAEDYMGDDEARQFLDGWAAEQNQRTGAER